MGYVRPVHRLFHRLVDDAALFPPGNAPMVRAVPAHRAAKKGPYAQLVGRFLSPASRMSELREQLGSEDLIELGLIADTGLDGLPAALDAVRAEPRLRLTMIEIALPADADQARAAAATIAELPGDVPAHIELPRVPGWREALDRLAAAGRGAKLRTGGLRPDMFPTPDEVAAFISACTRRDVPFKCTAGLHHAVRHTDPATGFHHHGFLNIALAACRATSGQRPAADPPEDALVEVLGTTDPARLAAEAGAVDSRNAQRARRLFVGYGSCSLREPYEDLLELGVIKEGG